VNGVDAVWRVGRMTLGPLTTVFGRLRVYGRENVPPTGGVVLALNHFHWLDPAAFGAACPRTIYYMAKIEAHRVPGLGQVIRAFGTFSVRRGESDREAVRMMRKIVADGHALGLFVEGTRQTTGVPGEIQPGAAMVALQENVPVVPAAIHGTEDWHPGNFHPVSVAWGQPMTFEGLPRNGKGYRAASTEIQAEIRRLWEWLREVHAAGRPRGLTPPPRP
jgi:1-acyl-sn-glycerol-3-phosphate acyltransferase